MIWAPNVYIGKDGVDWANGGYATLQTDGNFVVYDGDNNVMWSTNTLGGRAESKSGEIYKGNRQKAVFKRIM